MPFKVTSTRQECRAPAHRDYVLDVCTLFLKHGVGQTLARWLTGMKNERAVCTVASFTTPFPTLPALALQNRSIQESTAVTRTRLVIPWDY